jgi:hypothetical protein
VQPIIIAPLYINACLRAFDQRLVSGCALPRVPVTAAILQELNSLLFPIAAKRIKPSFVHETYFSMRPREYAGVPSTLTVYDMIHERFSGNFPACDRTVEFKRAAVSRADHDFCSSEQTRKDLQENYRLPDSKVSVTQLGHSMPSGKRDAGLALVGRAPFLA